jgi:hypothetical protein
MTNYLDAAKESYKSLLMRWNMMSVIPEFAKQVGSSV